MNCCFANPQSARQCEMCGTILSNGHGSAVIRGREEDRNRIRTKSAVLNAYQTSDIRAETKSSVSPKGGFSEETSRRRSERKGGEEREEEEEYRGGKRSERKM